MNEYESYLLVLIIAAILIILKPWKLKWKWTVIGIGAMITIALPLTEAHSVLNCLDSKLSHKQYDLFFKKGFHFMLTVQWYLKQNFDTLFTMIISFSAAIGFYRISYKLFMIYSMVAFYFFLDLLLFWYNYRTDYKTYWVCGGVVIVCILCLILPIDKRKTIYRSLS